MLITDLITKLKTQSPGQLTRGFPTVRCCPQILPKITKMWSKKQKRLFHASSVLYIKGDLVKHRIYLDSTLWRICWSLCFTSFTHWGEKIQNKHLRLTFFSYLIWNYVSRSRRSSSAPHLFQLLQPSTHPCWWHTLNWVSSPSHRYHFASQVNHGAE